MKRFKIEAKETHKRYGTKSKPAIFLILRNLIRVIIIKIHKIIISKKANFGLCNPKKKN